jgi:hypothetical protein
MPDRSTPEVKEETKLPPCEKGQLTPEVIHKELTKLLITYPSLNEAIIKWIEVNYFIAYIILAAVPSVAWDFLHYKHANLT